MWSTRQEGKYLISIVDNSYFIYDFFMWEKLWYDCVWSDIDNQDTLLVDYRKWLESQNVEEESIKQYITAAKNGSPADFHTVYLLYKQLIMTQSNIKKSVDEISRILQFW